VARHRRTRAIVLPAAIIGLLLFAAIGATYEVVRFHDRVAAEESIAQARLRVPARQHRHSRPRHAGPGQSAVRTQPRARPLPRPGPIPAGATPTVGPARGAEVAELGQITALLERSAAIRTILSTTTSRVASCELSMAGGLARVETVIRGRTELLDAAVAMTVSAIPDGDQLRGELVAALRFSLGADSQFADWMRDLSGWGTCPVPTLANSSYQAGLTDSALAAAAKADFLRQWNQLAAGFGQPAFGAGQI
jgi:hypothetical protein